MAKMPSKAQVARAVEAGRLYAGSMNSCNIRDQERFYKRFKQAMRPLEAVTSDAWEQVASHVATLGPRAPVPGKDF